MSEITLHIGIDNHDTPQGGCTTHFSILLIRKLLQKGVEFIDYPNLIRLNPNIPWKTRGNGAVVLRFRVIEKQLEDLLELIRNESEAYTQISRKTKYRQPGIAVFVGNNIPNEYRWLYKKALTDVVTLDIALKIAEKTQTIILSNKQNRGLIGALSAIGGLIDYQEDYTFELLAYRIIENMGKRERLVDELSVKRVELKYKGYLFSNYDFENDRMVITPHGPDPVLLGLRGDKPDILVKAFREIKVFEPIDFWCVFRTNQATDAHLIKRNISTLRPYQTGLIEGEVLSKPKPEPGGHIRIYIKDSTGVIPVYFYEPTKKLREIALKLIPGDYVRIGGSVRPPSSTHPKISFNAEKLEVIKLNRYIEHNPKCPQCGKTMKSAGKDKGYKCPRCGYYDPNARKILVRIERSLKEGIYTPPISSMHHLTKPLSRYGRENNGKPFILINEWCSFKLTGE